MIDDQDIEWARLRFQFEPELLPDSGEEKAKLALREACVIALAPGNLRTKLAAAATVLRFTKAPPVQRHATPDTADQWLRIATDAAKGPAHVR